MWGICPFLSYNVFFTTRRHYNNLSEKAKQSLLLLIDHFKKNSQSFVPVALKVINVNSPSRQIPAQPGLNRVNVTTGLRVAKNVAPSHFFRKYDGKQFLHFLYFLRTKCHQ